MTQAPWNSEGFKIGICYRPPLHASHSILGLSNNCGVAQTFKNMKRRFDRLYRVRAHLHHYTEYMEQAQVTAAVDGISQLIRDYNTLSKRVSGGGTYQHTSSGRPTIAGNSARATPAPDLFFDDDLDLSPM